MCMEVCAEHVRATEMPERYESRDPCTIESDYAVWKAGPCIPERRAIYDREGTWISSADEDRLE